MLAKISPGSVFFFLQCKISPCSRNTHDVSSPLALVKIVVASLPKIHERKSLLRFVGNKKNNDSDLNARALHYTNELLKNFSNLAKQTGTITDYQKQVLVTITHYLRNYKINPIPE